MPAKRSHKGRKIVIAGLVLVACAAPLLGLLLAPESAVGTAGLMARLPAYERFKCALCHTSAAPVSGLAELNVFGVDFSAAGMEWNPTLAMLNSDDDRCLNGFELGDENGDGTLDYPGQTAERGNPADGADCSIAMSFQTWGYIKEVFRSEIQYYFDEEELSRSQLFGDEEALHFP